MKIGIFSKFIILSAIVIMVALLLLGTPYLPKEKAVYKFFYATDDPAAYIKIDLMKLYPYKKYLIIATFVIGFALAIGAREKP